MEEDITADLGVWAHEQERLRSRIDLTDQRLAEDLRLIAGVDVAYWTAGEAEQAVACIVVVDAQRHTVLEQVSYHGPVTEPYVPGFLAFRELPLVLKAAERLATAPDLFMFDGNGYLHPRNMGIATHASFELDQPTIGVAKTYYRVAGAEIAPLPAEPGAFADIVKDGEVYGCALRTRANVKPVYVSCGNWVSLETARTVTLSLVERDSRLPIPTRLADIFTHSERKRLQEGGA
ncbi:MAG: endonuclease V [Actinomycetaceae bacterium]|nr:endonuclease V [Actinomycetaceae bacterium]